MKGERIKKKKKERARKEEEGPGSFLREYIEFRVWFLPNVLSTFAVRMSQYQDIREISRGHLKRI